MEIGTGKLPYHPQFARQVGEVQDNTYVENYSTRRPEMARAITNCWISLVPSKIV